MKRRKTNNLNICYEIEKRFLSKPEIITSQIVTQLHSNNILNPPV